MITDIKGDMLKNTHLEFEKHGYEVMCFNLLNPYWGMAYNPLELVKQAYMKETSLRHKCYAIRCLIPCFITINHMQILCGKMHLLRW